MTEIAFLVKPDSEMYRKYFKQKNELDKFVGFAFTKADLPFVVGLPFLFTAKQALGGAL